MTENMKKYWEVVSNDEALKQKMEALKDKSAEQLLEGAIELAKENGITLTQADFISEAPNGELSDDELEAAAGGCWWCDCFKSDVGDFMDKQDTDYIYRLIYKDKHGKLPPK